MKKEDARKLVISEWASWSRGKAGPLNGDDGFMFFGYLQTDKPHCLEFKSADGKWDAIHAWLLRAGVVSD
jgi:hypothetical protein